MHRPSSVLVVLSLALVGLATASSADGGSPTVAAGTGKSLQDGACRNTHVFDGVTSGDGRWTFTVETESRFFVSPSFILFPCPWSPAGAFTGPWNPAVGGTIPHAGGAGYLTLAKPKVNAGTLGATVYEMKVCVAGLCSSTGGTAELLFRG